MDLNTRCSQREADTEGDTGCDLPFTGSVLNTQIHGDRKRVLVARGRGGGGAGGRHLKCRVVFELKKL